MTVTIDRLADSPFYGGEHPSDVSLYSYADASRLLGVSASTARWWLVGRRQDGYEPVIRGASHSRDKGLSFNDLVEISAVGRLRRVHGVGLDAIRRAVKFAENELGLQRPLLREDLATFDGNIFLHHLGEQVGLSVGGQIALRGVIDAFLQRLDRDEALRPIGYYPMFSGMEKFEDPRPISISPLVAFGRPTIHKTGIKSAVVASRVDAGESIAEVADDYGLSAAQVRSAVIYEYAA